MRYVTSTLSFLALGSLLLPVAPLRGEPVAFRAIGRVDAKGGALEAKIRALLRAYRVDQKKLAVAIHDDTGKPRVLLNADEPLRPASNMKILTTAAGLNLLGKNHEYVTRLVSEALLESGAIAGDVHIEGNGDPNISGRFHDDKPLAIFRAWAMRLAQAGLRVINGDLVADDSLFDDMRYLPGWHRKFMGRWFAAEVSPLSFNDNCVKIHVHPGRPGEAARVVVSPSSAFVKVSGAPRTVAGSTRKVLIRRALESNVITVSGQIGAGVENWYDHVAIVDPGLFFAHALAEVLRGAGIRVNGKVRRITAAEVAAKKKAAGTAGAKPAFGVLVEHRSKLELDLRVINKRSQNLHAEILLKSLGRSIANEGSVEGGAKAIGKLLRKVGVDPSGLVVADGSGLSYDNRVTTRQLSRTLQAMREHEGWKLFRDSLPVAGVDGTLKSRFRRHPELRGRVLAKTGFVSSTSALSGYVERDGRVWSFSILLNAFTSSGVETAKQLQENIVARIHQAMARP